MKKIKRLLFGLIAASIAVCTFAYVRTAEAADSPCLNIRYNIYKQEDYEKKLKYNDVYLEDLMKAVVVDDSGYVIGKSKTDVTDSIDLLALEADGVFLGYWDDSTVYASPDGTQSAYAYYGLPSSIYGNEYTFTYSSNGRGNITAFSGEEFIASTTTTFKPGDDIVIEPMVKLVGKKLAGVSLCLETRTFANDFTFSSSDYYTIGSEADVSNDSSQRRPSIGFAYAMNPSTNSIDDGVETSAGAIHTKIDTTASGSYTIGLFENQKNTSMFIPYTSGSGTDAAITYENSTHFEQETASITIQGASNKTGITGITLGDSSISNPTLTDYSISESGVTTPAYSGTGGTNVPSNTYNIGDTIKSFTPTFTSPDTGYTSNSVDISASIEDLGSIAGVRYSSGENASIENALKNGTQITGSSGKFTVPMTGAKPGESVYVIVDVVASNGSTTQPYVIILPKAKSNTAILENVSFSSGVDLQDSSGNSITFASGTTKYLIAVASGTTSIDVTPIFDVSNNYYQTCKINGTTVTSNTSHTVTGIANNSKITIEMTAQDGVTKKTYEFTVKYLSIDTTLQSLTLTASGNTYTATYDSSSKTYTIDEVPFAVKNFTLTSVFKNNKQGVIIGSTTMTDGTASSFSFTAGSTNVNSHTETYTMTVTAEAGNTETYEVNINRKAADTGKDLDNLVITDNNGNSIGTFNPASQSFTVSSGDLDSTITSVKAVATLPSGSLATVKFDSTITNTQTLTFSGDSRQTVTFNIEVYSEADIALPPGTPRTITVSVTREKVKSSNADLDGISFSGNGTPNSIELQDLSGADTTFSKGALKYIIVVASNTTSIKVTPSFLTGKTCVVNTESATSGVDVVLTSGIGDGDTIQVKVTAEDGSTTKTYEFKVKHLSSDVTFKNIKFNATDVSEITVTYNSSSDKYTINNVPFAVKNFTLNVAFGVASQNVKIGSTTMTDGTASNFSFTASSASTSTWKQTYTMTITAESGNTKDYTIEINRVAADTGKDLDNLVITDNNGNSIGTFDPASQSFTVSPGDLDFTITSVKAVATLPSGSLATVKFGSTITNTQTLTFSGNLQQTVRFNIEVYSEADIASGGTPRTIIVDVTREEADDTKTFDYDAIANVEQEATGSKNIGMSLDGTIFKNNDDLDYGTSSVEITLKPDASTTKIYVDGVDKTNQTITINIPVNVNPQTVTKKFTIKTEANSTTGYEYTIQLQTKAAEDIFAFTFELINTAGVVESQTPNIAGNTFSYILDPTIYTTGVFKLNITTTSNKASVYTSTDNSNDATLKNNPFDASDEFTIGETLYVTVFSQYGNKMTRTIKTEYIDTRDNDNKIKDIDVNVGTLNYIMGVNDYLQSAGNHVTVPFTTSSITFTVTKNSSKSSLILGVSGVPQSLIVGINTFQFQLKAENETNGSIVTIEVERASGRTQAFVENLDINGVDTSTVNNINVHDAFSKYNNIFDFVLPRNSTNAYFAFSVSGGAKFRISENKNGTSSTTNNSAFPVSLTAGSYTIVKIEVWSEQDSIENPSTPTMIYEVYVYAANQSFELDDIQILDKVGGTDLLNVDGNTFVMQKGTDGNPLANQPVFEVSYKTSTAAIKFVMKDSYAVINGDGLKGLNINANAFDVTVTSEYQSLNPRMTAQGKTYTVNITRKEASTVDTLSSLSVIINGTEYITDFSSSNTGPYRIENIPDSATQAVVTATKTDNLSTLTGDTGTITLDLINNNSQTLHIYVQSELESEKTNGSRKDYQVIISREVIVLDNTCDVLNITATDGDGVKYLDKDSSAKNVFNPNTKPYNINIPAKLEGLNFAVEKAAATSKLFLDDTELTSATFYTAVTVGQVKTIKIKCLAQDGVSNNEYQITISRASYDTDNTLSDLKLNGTSIPGFNKDADTIYVVNVPYSQTTAVLEGTLNKPGFATITANDASSDSPYNLEVGDNLITIIVAAEDPTKTKTYKVKVVRDADNSLSDLEVLDKNGNDLITFDPTKNNYTGINVPYEIDEVTINYVAVGGNNVTVTGDGVQNLQEGLNTLQVKVQTNSGVVNTYEIEITRETGKTDNYIETYIDEDGDEITINKTNESYKYLVARNVTTFNPVITKSDGATITLPTNKDILLNQANVFKVVVTSQTGVDREYTFTVYRAETEFGIDDINVLDRANGNDIIDCNDTTKIVDYDIATKTYDLNVLSSVSTIYLEVKTLGQYAKVYVNGSLYTNSLLSINDGLNKYEIYVISEYGYLDSDATNTKSETYIVNITREPKNTDSTLKQLTVQYGGQTYTATQSELNAGVINIENIGNVTSVLIGAEANVPYPKTTITGIGNQSLPAFSGEVSGYIFTFTVTCTAEDGSKNEYKINLSRGTLDLDDYNTLDYITVVDSMQNEYLGQTTFIPTKNEYEITIPYGPQSYTIQANILSVANASLVGVGQFNITFTNNQDYKKTHTVYAVSESGLDGTKYTIKITCEAPSSDAELSDLKVDGVTIPGFNPENKGVYVLQTLPNTTQYIDITAIPKDQLSTVSGNIGTQFLNVGYNVFTVTVTAQSGATETYTISVVRDYPLPYLTDLDIVGEQLLDSKETPILFKKDVLEYHAIVTYLDGSATINVSVENDSHVVTCNKATVINNVGKTRTFEVALNVGTNRFTITVTSSSGKAQQYNVIIQRRGLESTNTNIDKIDIIEVPQFKEDYTNLENVYPKNESYYTVPNKIKDLEIKVVCENTMATYEIYNAEGLKTGENKVIIIVTAEDGETRRAVVVNVTRLPMKFTVNKEATKYECLESDKGELIYTINLGSDNAQAINDYTRYIEFAKEDNLIVEVLTDTANENCREVVLRVSDGSEEKLVRFELLRDPAPEVVSINYLVWILLAIVIIILIIILICVNKDKYGKISKKRKNA